MTETRRRILFFCAIVDLVIGGWLIHDWRLFVGVVFVSWASVLARQSEKT